MTSEIIQEKSDNILDVSVLNSSIKEEVLHVALDMGGSLIKMVYFARSSCSNEDQTSQLKENFEANGITDHQFLNGRLQFKKFETSKINECMEFISSIMQLQCNGARQHEARFRDKIIIKATGGGSYKFADLFKEKLGITLDKVDEMTSLVDGANFLLKANHSEVFTHADGRRHYMQIDQKDLYPFLLVNIGTGVSILKVEEGGKFKLVSGTGFGGCSFMGLGKLLTKCESFDELVELSRKGSDSVLDVLTRDIYGEMKDSEIVFPPTAVASNFGKPVSDNKELDEYKSEDVAASLLRLISSNIGQIACLNAFRFSPKKIFFGGSFLRHDHTINTISQGVSFWSGGALNAMFLRHDGFLGALGAFASYQNLGLDDLMKHQLVEEPRNARIKGESFHVSPVGDVKENGSSKSQEKSSN